MIIEIQRKELHRRRYHSFTSLSLAALQGHCTHCQATLHRGLGEATRHRSSSSGSPSTSFNWFPIIGNHAPKQRAIGADKTRPGANSVNPSAMD